MNDSTAAPTMTVVHSERTNYFRWVWFLWLASAGVFLLVSEALSSLMSALGVPAVWKLIPRVGSFVAWLLILARLYRRFDFRTERNVELANEEAHRPSLDPLAYTGPRGIFVLGVMRRKTVIAPSMARV